MHEARATVEQNAVDKEGDDSAQRKFPEAFIKVCACLLVCAGPCAPCATPVRPASVMLSQDDHAWQMLMVWAQISAQCRCTAPERP